MLIEKRSFEPCYFLLDVLNNSLSRRFHIFNIFFKKSLKKPKAFWQNINFLKKPRLNVNPNIQLPIVGGIVAGKPIEPMGSDQVLELADLLVGNNRYVLQVIGNSMTGDHICDGDFIICKRCHEANNGDIVVALIDEKATTLKRFQRNSDDTITLLPSNPDLKPLTYRAEQVKIEGIFLGLIRLTDYKKITEE